MSAGIDGVPVNAPREHAVACRRHVRATIKTGARRALERPVRCLRRLQVYDVGLVRRLEEVKLTILHLGSGEVRKRVEIVELSTYTAGFIDSRGKRQVMGVQPKRNTSGACVRDHTPGGVTM